MKKSILFLISIFSATFAVVTFEKNLGAEWDDHGNAVCQTSDGGYLFAGSMVDSLDYTYTFLIMTKLHSDGEMDWLTWVTGAVFTDASFPYNVGYSVIESNDGGYVVAGSIDAVNMGAMLTEVFVVKTDTEGNIIWYYQDINDGQLSSVAFQIIQTKDNGYIIICENRLGHVYNYDDFIIKLDSNGKELWRKYYYLGITKGRSILQTNEGGYAFISTKKDDLENDVQILLKTDSLGNETWIKTYPGLFSYSMGYTLKNTSDDGFLIFGMTDQESYGNLARLIKTDVNGEMLWEKYYGILENTQENTVGRSLYITADGGFILAGYTEKISSGLADAWLIKTDSEGNEIWKKTYGREGDDRFYSVIQTADGGYIMTGYTDSYGYGGKDMWIIKTDENGTEIESPFLPQTTELFQNFPNPFNPVTSISYALSQAGQVELSVYNLNGQFVKRLVDEKQEKGAHKVEFDVGDLTSGLYIYSLKVDGKFVQSRKMMLLK
jgi:hypothetical protein